MGLTTDPADPRLEHGVDTGPREQAEVYLVLPAEELAKGFVRPYRDSYVHVGVRPRWPTRPLTEDERRRYGGNPDYVAYEEYPESEAPLVGRAWKASQLSSGCGTETVMGRALSETYARDPKFYGATYCVGCRMHLPVEEFVWSADRQPVGS